ELSLCRPFTRFFFSSFGGRPALHPFPTRRSSDLDRRGARADHRHPLAGQFGSLIPPGRVEGLAAKALEAGDVGRRRLAEGAVGRSEEHTSELQSPCNLVCRLLLEKKKQHSHLLRS